MGWALFYHSSTAVSTDLFGGQRGASCRGRYRCGLWTWPGTSSFNLVQPRCSWSPSSPASCLQRFVVILIVVIVPRQACGGWLHWPRNSCTGVVVVSMAIRACLYSARGGCSGSVLGMAGGSPSPPGEGFIKCFSTHCPELRSSRPAPQDPYRAGGRFVADPGRRGRGVAVPPAVRRIGALAVLPACVVSGVRCRGMLYMHQLAASLAFIHTVIDVAAPTRGSLAGMRCQHITIIHNPGPLALSRRDLRLWHAVKVAWLSWPNKLHLN